MLELRNKTPFETAIAPATDKDFNDYIVVVVKGTFDIENNSQDLQVAEEQDSIVFADEYYDESNNSSIENVADSAMVKLGTDILLKGNAYNFERKRSVETLLSVGNIQKKIRVFGDRFWERSMATYSASQAKPFEIMPMKYENAFGGKVLVTEDGEQRIDGFEKRNPVGKGFYEKRDDRDLEGFPLPNLESPNSLIDNWRSQPSPISYGAIAPHWLPRYQWGGTYDKAWEKERMPFLPADFSERYFSSAPDDQIIPVPLQGGEVVEYHNLSKDRITRFAIPTVKLRMRFSKKQQVETGPEFIIDTVNIDAEQQRLNLTWRARLPCTRELLYHDWIAVKMA